MTIDNTIISLPVAATIDLQYRLPPFQQVIFNREILISLILFAVALAIVVYFYRKAALRNRQEKRKEALQLARKILLKRGGTDDDFMKVEFVFAAYPKIDPAQTVMLHEVFREKFFPILDKTYTTEFAERMEKLYFPPPKDTNAIAKEKDLQKLVESTKHVAQTQAVAAMIDLMDATLKPGAVLRMTFEGVDGGCECLVMSHNMQCLNITLPANNAQLVDAIKPGMTAEGNFESGPSLMAFTSTVLSVLGGSMPFCRLSVWKHAWEVRKRDSVRLAISLDIDFQHISTATAASIKMSQLEREMGAVRPGRLVDLSLGGGGIETSSDYDFGVGDFIRFTASLIPGHSAATLLGAIVDIHDVDPEKHGGMTRRIGVQFLALDDVSQRLLARAMRHLQETASREEWFKAQRMLEQMRRNNVEETPAPTPDAGPRTATKAQSRPDAHDSTRSRPRPSPEHRNAPPAPPPSDGGRGRA